MPYDLALLVNLIFLHFQFYFLDHLYFPFTASSRDFFQFAYCSIYVRCGHVNESELFSPGTI